MIGLTAMGIGALLILISLEWGRKVAERRRLLQGKKRLEILRRRGAL